MREGRSSSVCLRMEGRKDLPRLSLESERDLGGGGSLRDLTGPGSMGDPGSVTSTQSGASSLSLSPGSVCPHPDLGRDLTLYLASFTCT